LGLFGYLGLLLTLAGSMTLVAKGAARVLGMARFRWFDERPTPPSWWRLLSVWAVAALSPLCVSIGLFWVSLLLAGDSKPSLRVDVLDGAARAAGMRDGDRIVRVGSQLAGSWDEARSLVQKAAGPIPVQVERDGQALELLVTPRNGRIGVSPQYDIEPIGPIAALKRAGPMPLLVVRDAARNLLQAVSGQERAELRGPVGIVREAGKTGQSRTGELLLFAAALAAYFWPFIGGVSLFDAAALAIFRATYPESAAGGERGYRLERLRQALLLSLSGLPMVLLLVALATAGFPAGAVLMLWIGPTAAAAPFLIWIAGNEVWRRWSTALCLLSALFVPCVGVLVVLVLIQRIRRGLQAEGFRVGWLRSAPQNRTSSNY
jgi:regulator of sigma E protease